MKLMFGILFLISAFVLAEEPTCFVSTQNTQGLPNRICLSGSSWTTNPDGDMVVTVWGPNLQLQMDEVLPRPNANYNVAKVEGSFVNRQEDCGFNLHSSLYIGNIIRHKNIDFKNIEVSVLASSTSDNCHSPWEQRLIQYTREP